MTCRNICRNLKPYWSLYTPQSSSTLPHPHQTPSLDVGLYSLLELLEPFLCAFSGYNLNLFNVNTLKKTKNKNKPQTTVLENPNNDVFVLVGLLSVKCVSLEACGVNTLLESWKQNKTKAHQDLILTQKIWHNWHLAICSHFLNVSFTFLHVTVFYFLPLYK